MQGIDCSQVVAGRFADELEMEESLLRKMSACFGGGMQCGETCGAVTGALMVIGLKYGHSMNNDLKQKRNTCVKRLLSSSVLFAEKYESCMCRELLGHDISKEDEMEQVLEQGLLFDFCSMCCKRHNRNTGEDDIDAAYKGRNRDGHIL